MSYFQKIDSYVREAYEELLHKVSWPTWEELQQTTAIVLVALGLVTLVVAGLDAVCNIVLQFIYKLLAK